MSDLVAVNKLDNGAIWRVTFGKAKGNILDRPTMAALRGVFREARASRPLKAVCLEGAGRHFSFGASVPEHLPDQVASMLTEIRLLVMELIDSHVVVVAAVRGQCLGGGLELALAGGPIFASRESHFGQPEIRLGVIAPAASVLLPYRVSQPVAEDLLLSGRSITADEALRCGLVQTLADDPEAAALGWFTEHLQPRSAAALNFALAAARGQMRIDVRRRLAEVEQLYLERLMRTQDANEGLTAFLGKRQPAWTHQ